MKFEYIISRLHARPIDGVLLALAIFSVAGYTIFAASLDAVGFPLDDSWIHQTYARNLAEYGEWTFVPDKPSAASTAPLYSMLLAIGHAIGLSPFAWAHFLGVLALFGTSSISVRLAERLFPDVPWVGEGTGVLIALSWHFGWAAASGMETMLFMMLSLALIALTWRELDDVPTNIRALLLRGGQVGAVGGLLVLTRPEGIGLVGLAGLLMLVSDVQANRQRYMIWSAGVVIGFLIVLTPFLLFNYAQTDRIFPTTASAKIAENAPLREDFILVRYLKMLIPLIAGAQFVWLPGIIWGLVVVAKRVDSRRQWLYWLPPIWAFAHLTLFVLRLPAPYQHGRYAMPTLPPMLIFAVGGILVLLQAGKNTMPGRVASRTLFLSAVLAVPAFWWIGGKAYGSDVRIINTEMVKTAKWIADSGIPTDELLAVHDIGAVGYYAPRDIFDLAGLITPDIVPIIRDHEALMIEMCQRDVKWLMVLPEQRPASEDDPRLGGEARYSTNEPYIIDAGGEGNMKVYHLDFSNGCQP